MPTASTMTPTQAYEACRTLASTHYENFPVTSLLLPRPVRRHMHALYAFARGVDDLGDEAAGDRLALLDGWEAWLRWALEGAPAPGGPPPAAFVALRESQATLDLPIEPFLRLIEANRRDQRRDRYETFEDLREYCSFSADPVGRLVLHIFGYRDRVLWPLSDATCTALQLTNFWQDVVRDFQMGRIYLPAEDMRRFGVTEETIASREPTQGFRDLMRFEVGRARDLFTVGRGLLREVRGRFRFDLALFTLGGEAVLERIESSDHDVLSGRPALSGADKSRLAVRASRSLLPGGRV
jgi:squalene synthase HpnC